MKKIKIEYNDRIWFLRLRWTKRKLNSEKNNFANTFFLLGSSSMKPDAMNIFLFGI